MPAGHYGPGLEIDHNWGHNDMGNLAFEVAPR